MSEPRYRRLSNPNAAQKVISDIIAKRRNGSVPAPFQILLEVPELAMFTQDLGGFYRFDTGIEPRLTELIILTVTIHWRCDYAFELHAKYAKAAGLDSSIITDLRKRLTPTFGLDIDGRIAYDFAKDFITGADVSDRIFDAATARFGREKVVIMAGLVGFYCYISTLLRIFRVPVNADVT